MNRKGHGGSGLIAIIPAGIAMFLAIPVTFPLFLYDYSKYLAIILESLWIGCLLYCIVYDVRKKKYVSLIIMVIYLSIIGLTLGLTYIMAGM